MTRLSIAHILKKIRRTYDIQNYVRSNTQKREKKHRQISSMTHTRTDTHNEGWCAFWYQNELKKYKKIGSNKRIKDHKIYIAQNNINVHIKS